MERLKSASDHHHCDGEGGNNCSGWTGREVQSVDICDYQDGMCAVDKDNQHRALDDANPFKKWYKK
eukprot:11673753-Ditylum_brightwellii.AAC.1